MFKGSQNNKFPSLPMTHPSLFGAFQILSLELIFTRHIRINLSQDTDANLMYLLSDEGRMTTDLMTDETFALNKSSLVDIFHTQTVLSQDVEMKHVSSGEKQTEPTFSSCALKGSWTGLPSLAFQTRIVPSRDPDKIYEPSWE